MASPMEASMGEVQSLRQACFPHGISPNVLQAWWSSPVTLELATPLAWERLGHGLGMTGGHGLGMARELLTLMTC